MNLEGSLEPADSGSIILRGMQFPQQQWVRGQRGEPAAPLGIAVLPPLPNAAGRGVGARCRGAGPAGPRGHGGEGRRRSGGRVGRGGGRAGAAGEAAEAQCGVVSKDVTNCLQEQQTLVNPWAAGGGSAGGVGGTRGPTAECPGAVPPLPAPRLHSSGRVTAATSPQRGYWDTSVSQLVTVGSPLVPWALALSPLPVVVPALDKQEHRGKCSARATERGHLHHRPLSSTAASIPGHLHPWPLPFLITSSTATPGHLDPSLFLATVPTGTPSEHSGVQRGTPHAYHGHHPAQTTLHTSPRLHPHGKRTHGPTVTLGHKA